MATVSSSATLRADLADVVKDNMYGNGDLVGLNAMPLLPVSRKSGNFATVAFSEQPTNTDSKRAPGAGYDRQRREVTDDNYACVEFGREEPIDDGSDLEISEYFDIEVDTAQSLAGRILVEQEVRLEAILFDIASTFASYTTNGSDWTTAANGLPMGDIRAAVDSLKSQINGGIGNARLVAICTDTTLNAALATNEIKTALNAGSDISFSSKDAASAALARACGLDSIHSTSIQNNGAAVWDNYLFGIYMVGSGRSLQSTPQVGRTFLWESDASENALVETYRDESVRSDIVRVRQHVQEKVLSARCGHILTGLNA
jgi:hypothetical protein